MLVLVVLCLVWAASAEKSSSGGGGGGGGGSLFSSWRNTNSNNNNNADAPPAASSFDDYFISDADLRGGSRRASGGSFGGSTFSSSSSSSPAAASAAKAKEDDSDLKAQMRQRRMRAMQQREYDYDDAEYSNRGPRRRDGPRDDDARGVDRQGRRGQRGNNGPGPSRDLVPGGALAGLYSWTKHLPRVNFRVDPVINFKLKQKITSFGACITLGMDYLSELAQWRAYCAVEDTIVGGRFSIRGSELGWTKSWFLNLGLGEESTAKIKLRMGLNLQSLKAYARVRFRTEPLSTFDIGEGLSCAGKLPLPGLLPIFTSLPLRVEYRLRINTPQPDFQIKRGRRDGTHISLTTGIDSIDMSLDELNFCLEWDDKSPVWGIGLVKSGPPKRTPPPQQKQQQQQQAPTPGSAGRRGAGPSGGSTRMPVSAFAPY